MTSPSARAEALPRQPRWPWSLRIATGLPSALATPLLTALFVTPLLAVALAVREPTPLLWFSLIADLVVLFAFAVATLGRPFLLIGILTVWFVLQRLVLALIAPHVDPDTLRLLVTYKEGFYMVLLAAGALGVGIRLLQRERSLTPLLLADLLAVALLALLAVSFFFVSAADLSPRLTYARRFAAPLLLYLGGRLLLPDRAQLLEGLRLLVVVALGVATFGLAERFLLGASFWSRQVDALGFYEGLGESGLLPSTWVRPFQGVPEGIFVAFPVDVPVRRLVATYLEPTTLGAFLALALLLLLFMPGPGGRRAGRLMAPAAAALALAVAATVSRGAMQIALIGAGVVLVLTGLRALRPLWRLEAAVIAGVMALLLAALLVSSLSFSQFPNRRDQLQDVLGSRLVSGLEPVPLPPPTDKTLNEGARTHINGLSSGLKQMLEDPGGLGVGAAGAWSQAPEVGSESTVGTLAAQLGVPGLALWLAFHAAVVAALAQASLRLRRREAQVSAAAMVLAAALAGLFASAWFSESAAGLLGNAFFFLFAGWAVAVAAPSEPGLCFRWLPFRQHTGGAIQTEGL